MGIGKRIRFLRLAKGYAQTELATISKLNPPAISQYESGKREPINLSLGRIAKALGTSTDYLIYGENEKDDISEYVLSLFNSLTELEKEQAICFLRFLSVGNK